MALSVSGRRAKAADWAIHRPREGQPCDLEQTQYDVDTDAACAGHQIDDAKLLEWSWDSDYRADDRTKGPEGLTTGGAVFISWFQ